MQTESSFAALMQRVRTGDGVAAAQLVRQYEPEIRRIIRVRLTDQRLQRYVDSMDICQSVLANFFARTALGQFELQEPAQLLKLLATMARNKLRDHVRRQQAARRDQRRLEGGEALHAVADSGESPSQIVAGRELLERIRGRLTAEEQHLAEQRTLGREWAEIAAELGAKPDALRIKLARAMDRVTAEMDL